MTAAAGNAPGPASRPPGRKGAWGAAAPSFPRTSKPRFARWLRKARERPPPRPASSRSTPPPSRGCSRGLRPTRPAPHNLQRVMPGGRMSILGLQPEVEPRDQVLHLADVQNRSFLQPRSLMGAARTSALDGDSAFATGMPRLPGRRVRAGTASGRRWTAPPTALRPRGCASTGGSAAGRAGRSAARKLPIPIRLLHTVTYTTSRSVRQRHHELSRHRPPTVPPHHGS